MVGTDAPFGSAPPTETFPEKGMGRAGRAAAIGAAAAVGAAGVAAGAATYKWGNYKSKLTYGHTFTKHGSKKTPQQLKDRARSTGTQVGQWIDEKKAADFLSEIAKNGEGVYDVKLPNTISARSFLPDGNEVIPDMVRIVVKPDGSIRTAFPYNSAYIN